MTRRSDRVADRIRDVLAGVIRAELRDPRIGFVTVTDVSLSSDLRYARVFVSFMDPPHPGVEPPGAEPRDAAGTAEALRALSHATPFLRRRLAREAGLRRTPELRFEIDGSVVEGLHIEAILEEVAPAEETPVDGSGDRESDEPER